MYLFGFKAAVCNFPHNKIPKKQDLFSIMRLEANFTQIAEIPWCSDVVGCLTISWRCRHGPVMSWGASSVKTFCTFCGFKHFLSEQKASFQCLGCSAFHVCFHYFLMQTPGRAAALWWRSNIKEQRLHNNSQQHLRCLLPFAMCV